VNESICTKNVQYLTVYSTQKRHITADVPCVHNY